MFGIPEKDNNQIIPTFRRVNVGQSFLFLCKGTQNLKWYFQKKNELPRNKPVLSSKPTIICSKAKLEHSGYYYCYGRCNYCSNHGYFVAMARLKVYGKYNCISVYTNLIYFSLPSLNFSDIFFVY